MLHRTLLYHTQNTQSASENTAVLRESDRARCSTEHCCTHREWQSASQNTAVLTESGRVLHRTLLYSQRRTARSATELTLVYQYRGTDVRVSESAVMRYSCIFSFTEHRQFMHKEVQRYFVLRTLTLYAQGSTEVSSVQFHRSLSVYAQGGTEVFKFSSVSQNIDFVYTRRY